nr:hypothetical protein [Chthoniobacter flavus]
MKFESFFQRRYHQPTLSILWFIPFTMRVENRLRHVVAELAEMMT